MVQTWQALLLIAIVVAAAGCGTTRHGSGAGGSQPSRREATAGTGCPRAVLTDASSIAPVRQVLRAAQGLLARQRYASQGTVYRLTPRNAPIDEVFRLAASHSPLDETQPGLVVLHRTAARLCGERTAQASWAIHYWIGVSVIADAAGLTFIVKTKRGWRFWGNWCGAGKPQRWRNSYCY